MRMGESPGDPEVVVAGRTEPGHLCTVSVERGRLGDHLLRYNGSESVVAALRPDVVELLLVAFSVTGRTAVHARCPGGGACTLLLIAQPDRIRLYFHAAVSFGVVLDRGAADRLYVALDGLTARGSGRARP